MVDRLEDNHTKQKYSKVYSNISKIIITLIIIIILINITQNRIPHFSKKLIQKK